MPLEVAENQEVVIKPEGLGGLLGVPETACGVVIFAHGSGSGRMSPRNNYVAQKLRDAGLATFLLDLLTQTEERDRRNVFDIGLLSRRLLRAREWIAENFATAHLPVGYFGASTGAAAALRAAAEPGSEIGAVVSRGGRPDMAHDALPAVTAPTLLLVGSRDEPVIGMNDEAYQALGSKKRMILIEGATHLFEEPGTLDVVVHHAAEWFSRHLCGGEPETDTY